MALLVLKRCAERLLSPSYYAGHLRGGLGYGGQGEGDLHGHPGRPLFTILFTWTLPYICLTRSLLSYQSGAYRGGGDGGGHVGGCGQGERRRDRGHEGGTRQERRPAADQAQVRTHTTIFHAELV